MMLNICELDDTHLKQRLGRREGVMIEGKRKGGTWKTEGVEGKEEEERRKIKDKKFCTGLGMREIW